MLLLGLSGVLYFSSIHVSSDAQLAINFMVIGAMVALHRYADHQGLARITFLSLAIFLVLRYIHWRILFTITFVDPLSLLAALTLLVAEFYGIFVFLLNVFVSARPVQRQATTTSSREKNKLPNVDVFIPSYNEGIELLRVTLIAAREIHYPKEKLRIYLLDDGGTHNKRHQPDQTKSLAAWLRRHQLKKLCRELGVQYMTRHQNDHAKAGNMNAALPHTHGDLILILDADHVPTVDFLEKTVHYFIEDEKLFLVQTPHFFVNPDPIEKNLDLFQKMPSENHMFYSTIQPGLDFWGGSFFCGSAAILRRKALLENNGFSGETITEDAETALTLHSKGWRSCYLKYPLISGLQPETFSSFMVQRMRWAQGMVQLFLLKNPLKMKGLSWPQKLCYLSNMSYWFFPFARMIFVFAPAAFLVFGLQIYAATAGDILIYTVPYIVALLMASSYMYRKVRWNFISNIYETMQSLHSFNAVMAVLKNPRSPKFGVTPKSETLDEDFISPLARPFYWMVAATAFITLLGLWRFYAIPEERSLIAFALFWSSYNFLLYTASLGALMERRQRRTNPRLPAGFEATIWLNDGAFKLPVIVEDISVGGTNISLTPQHAEQVKAGDRVTLHGINPATGKPFDLPIEVVARWEAGKRTAFGSRFASENSNQYRDIILLAHGDSRRWLKWSENRAPDPGIIKSTLHLSKISIIYICRYLVLFIINPMIGWLISFIKGKPPTTGTSNNQVKQ
ncbi:MAG: UDP-forming cellulose synthase catalytic subunit [Thiotrichaceae bacterium]|nr:UDP-forming cellulose synthase catalytic subunit [Thiotrichaceae bacterium]